MRVRRRVFERYFTPSDERQFFKTVGQFSSVLAQRDLNFMLLMRRTGIRVTAMSLFTVGDAEIALLEGRFIIRDEISKGNKGYELNLTNAARINLRKLLKIRTDMGYGRDVSLPLLMSRNHRGLSVRSIQDRVKHWRELAGLSCDVSPHWFRHTLAKRIMSNSTARDPRLVVMDALGHDSFDSTLIYIQPDKEEVNLALEEAM